MLSAFVIVFRECLEAALIISIVMAASRGIVGRSRSIASGVLAGLTGAILLAFFAGGLANLFGGAGTEIFNAFVLFVAVTMLGWHHVWMGTHGAELAGQSRAISHEVREGARPLSALAVISLVAILREGSETVLFLYGISVDAASSGVHLLVGGALGIACAVLLGVLLYAGLVRIPLKHIFKVTGIILVLIAGGLAAQGTSYLVQGGLLPPLGYDIWDTSGLLSQDRPLGLLLHILVGYIDRPMGIQILAYALTLAVILGVSWLITASGPKRISAVR